MALAYRPRLTIDRGGSLANGSLPLEVRLASTARQPPGGGYTDALGVASNADTGELLIVDNDTDEILIYDNEPNGAWDRNVALPVDRRWCEL